MTSEQAIEQLDRYIRSRMTVIGIESYETNRVLKAVQAAVFRGMVVTGDSGTPQKIFTWTMSRGICEIKPDLSEEIVVDPNPEAEQECFEVFQFIIDQWQELPELDVENEGAVFVLKDVMLTNPAVVRSLRDASEALIDRNQTIILLSPALDIPLEIQKDVKVMSWPLPDNTELRAIVEDFIDEVDAVNRLNGDLPKLVSALKGLNSFEADQVLAQAVIKHGQLDVNAVDFCLELKKDVIGQSQALEYYPQRVKDSEVGGLDRLRNWLGVAGKAMSPEAAKFGIQAPRGVLVAGVPGCGKSLTAKMTASLWNVPLIRLDIGALFDSLLGKTESQTREALKIIGAIGECVVWIDEVEKAIGSGGGEMDGGTSARMFGTLLTAMEESLAESGAFLFATANEAWNLKPEFIRRFSKVFFVDLPGRLDRADILAIHLTKAGRNPDLFDLDAFSGFTEGFTGSELEGVVQAALWTAFSNETGDVTDADVTLAIENTVPLSKSMREAIKKMRDWAERAEPASTFQDTGKKVVTKAPSTKGKRAIKI